MNTRMIQLLTLTTLTALFLATGCSDTPMGPQILADSQSPTGQNADAPQGDPSDVVSELIRPLPQIRPDFTVDSVQDVLVRVRNRYGWWEFRHALRIVVANEGNNIYEGPLDLQILDFNPEAGANTRQVTRSVSLRPDTSVTIDVTMSCSQYGFWAVTVDPNMLIAELNESNNSRTAAADNSVCR